MTRSFSLTIDIESENIQNGLGYIVSFTLPAGVATPADMPEYYLWREEVRQAVMNAGDAPLHPEGYVSKIATADLMEALADINRRYGITIGCNLDVPAVQIRSSNPLDPLLDLDLKADGSFSADKKRLVDFQRVARHGRTRVIEGACRDYPFEANTNDRPVMRPPGR